MKNIIFVLCMFALRVNSQTVIDTCTIEVPGFKPLHKGLHVRFSNGETVAVSRGTPHKYMDWYYYAGSRFKMWEVKKVNVGYPRGWEARVRPLDIPRGKYIQHVKPLTLTQKWENFLNGK